MLLTIVGFYLVSLVLITFVVAWVGDLIHTGKLGPLTLAVPVIFILWIVLLVQFIIGLVKNLRG